VAIAKVFGAWSRQPRAGGILLSLGEVPI
jgi:hypothetical protein